MERHGKGVSDDGYKLKQETFRLDIRENFLMMRTAQEWDRLPREAV